MNAAIMFVCLSVSATPGQAGPPPIFQAPLIKVMKRFMDAPGADGERQSQLYHQLLHNRIAVGLQFLKPDNPKLQGDPKHDFSAEPTTYFHRRSPVGLVMAKYKNGNPPFAVVDMDVGTMAAYARKGQTVHFFERDTTIAKLSRTDKDKKPLFTYLQDAIARGADVKIFGGEPRPSFEKHSANGFYQVIVVNTYKLPVVTVHKDLMTKEGMKMLMDKTRDDGILCFHTSSRYYELDRIIASVAADLKFASISATDMAPWADPWQRAWPSSWIMVARKQEQLAHLKVPEGYSEAIKGKFFGPAPYWHPTDADKKYVWTDKGPNSFKGLYRTDPIMSELDNVVTDVEDLIIDRVGQHALVTTIARPFHGAVQALARLRTLALNGEWPRKIEKKDKDK